MKSMWFKIRKEANVTQTEVAKKFKTTKQNISIYEKRPDKMPIIMKIYYLKLRNAKEDKILIKLFEKVLGKGEY